MVASTSRLAYNDCYDIMNTALEDERGVRVRFNEHGAAVQFRIRAHYARRLDRELNREVYATDHPMFGVSEYDHLVLKLRFDDHHWYIYIEKADAGAYEVESLADLPTPAPDEVVEEPVVEEITSDDFVRKEF